MGGFQLLSLCQVKTSFKSSSQCTIQRRRFPTKFPISHSHYSYSSNRTSLTLFHLAFPVQTTETTRAVARHTARVHTSKKSSRNPEPQRTTWFSLGARAHGRMSFALAPMHRASFLFHLCARAAAAWTNRFRGISSPYRCICGSLAAAAAALGFARVSRSENTREAAVFTAKRIEFLFATLG